MRNLHRAGERFVTRTDIATTWHSFSYGAHYDPQNTRFGPLQAINVEHVAPGRQYDTHRHADVEIVTWVLDGALRHADSTGHGGVITPGTAQRLSAGAGVEHTEANASDSDPVVFVQMMLLSEHAGEPEYAQVAVGTELGRLAPTVDVAAPARLYVARLDRGVRIDVPSGARRLVHVTRGELSIDGAAAATGDELRTDDADPIALTADAPAEALVWILDA